MMQTILVPVNGIIQSITSFGGDCCQQQVSVRRRESRCRRPRQLLQPLVYLRFDGAWQNPHNARYRELH